MSQVPWTRIREFKEEQERKKRREFEAALGRAQLQVPGQQDQQQSQGPATARAKPFQERFKESYFKERLMFGGVVGAVTGAFFGGLDAVQGIKKGEAFGVMLNTLPSKAKFSGEHIGSAALVFSIFYSSYQGIKYISKVARDEDDWGNPATAAITTVAPLLLSATFRRNVPYAVLLIGMDVFSEATASTPSSTTSTTS
ncbi:Hypothetical protein NocV09_00701550 [Nannochloropsis oceanica]